MSRRIPQHVQTYYNRLPTTFVSEANLIIIVNLKNG